MKLLTFDTSLDKTYITLANDDKILETKEIVSDAQKYHSAYLISGIAKMLKNNNLLMNDIDWIGTNIGPGSFTGIRVCLTVAKIISQQLNIKAKGVSSLEILSQANESNKPSLVLMDARKEKAYIAIYEGEKTLLKPQAILLEDIKNYDLSQYFVIADAKMSEYVKDFCGEVLDFSKNDLPLGKYLSKIVYQSAQKGENTDWRNLEPLYIQPAPVSVRKKVV